MLYAKVVLTVKGDETTANNKVVLYRGDGNVDIEFTLRSVDYVLSECVEAQLILLRPYAKSVFSELSEINQNKVRFTITTDMIDELAELESYVIQIRLFGPDKVARVTLPPCYDVLQIRNPLTMEPSDEPTQPEEPQYITDFTFGDKDAVRLNGPTGITDLVYIYPAEEGLPMNFEVHMPDSPGWETVNYVFYNETNPYVELRLLASTHNLEGSLRVIETYSGIEKTIPIYVRPEIRLTVHYKATDNDYANDYLEFKMENDTGGYVHFGSAEADDYGRVGYITLKIDIVYTPELFYNSAMSMIILDDIANLTSDTEIWISDDSTTVHYSRPLPMHTLTVHYKYTDGYYEDDILMIAENYGNNDNYELHLNGYSDAYGTVNTIQIHEGIYHIFLEDKSPEFSVISYGQHDIVSDIEIWINDYENVIYYENPNPYYVEYTIDVADDCTDTVGYANTDGTPYLPKVNDEIPTNVTIKLKDGTTTTSLNTLAKDVESIKVDYDENTQKVIFGYSGNGTTCSKISGINYIYFSNKITDMYEMFYDCSSLTSLDVSNWDMSNVTSMDWMFSGCSSLTSLDTSNWDTSNVTSMSGMFYCCSSLTSLDVSNWDTSNVEDMNVTFSNCSSLTSLDVSNWDTSNVTKMDSMFNNCSSLTSLDVSNWDIGNVRDTYDMFGGCSSLTSLDVSNWDVRNVDQMDDMFRGCSSLTSLDLSNWDVSNVYFMNSMFQGCSSLTSLDLSNWDTSNVDEYTNMFKDTPEISDWNYDGSNYTNFTLTEEETGYAGTFPWNLVTVAKYTFTSTTDTLPAFNSEFTNYTTTDVNNGDGTTRTIAIGKTDTLPTSISFEGKSALLTVEKLDISNLTTMAKLFSSCTQLTSVNMDEWDTSNIKDMQYMFFNCKKLTSLDLSHFNTANVINMGYMFHSCSGLTSVDLTNWNTAKVTVTKGMFNGCTSLTSLDLSHFNTTKVTDMNKMFYKCSSLTSLDVSNWDTGNVENATSMFQDTPEISDWNYDGDNYTNFTLTESDTGYAGIFPWNEPDEPETVILTLHFYTPDRYMGECALINEVDSSLEAAEHYFGLEDDFGLYTTIEVKAGVAYHIALTSFGAIFAEGVFSFTEDTELWTIKRDSTIYTENPGSNWTLTVHYYHPEDDQYAESVIRISESVFEDGEYTSTNVVYCNFELTGETCYENDFGRYITMNYKRGRQYEMSLQSIGFDLYIDELVRYLNIGANTDLWIINGDSTIYTEKPGSENPYRVEYTLYVTDGSTDALNINKTRYLPQIADDMGETLDYSELITIHLKDGTTTNDMGTLVTDIERVVIEYPEGTGAVKFEGSRVWFNINITNIKEILYINVDNIVDMSSMFENCEFLESINGIEYWNTSNVGDMSAMFSGCTSLTSLDLSNWDTSNVDGMTDMFSRCSSLTSLDLSNWDTSSVTSTNLIFTAVPADCQIYVGPNWTLTEEETGFAGTFTRV